MQGKTGQSDTLTCDRGDLAMRAVVMSTTVLRFAGKSRRSGYSTEEYESASGTIHDSETYRGGREAERAGLEQAAPAHHHRPSKGYDVDISVPARCFGWQAACLCPAREEGSHLRRIEWYWGWEGNCSAG